MSLVDELFPLLQPILFWLSNILEFYHYLTTRQSSLSLIPPPPDSDSGEGATAEETREEDENPLVSLQNVMVYTFQQAFYPISKVFLFTTHSYVNKVYFMLSQCVQTRVYCCGFDVVLNCQVLFHSLPVMLEKCVDYKLVSCGLEPIVIDQAVDFLQGILDLLTEVHVHLEVCVL